MKNFNTPDPFYPAEDVEIISDDLDHSVQRKLHLPNLPLFQWKAFIVFIILALGISAHFLWTSELFEIPKDVRKSRSFFTKAKERYINTKNYWDVKQDNFLQQIKKDASFCSGTELLQKIREAPPEVLISFLVSKLGISFERLKDVAVSIKGENSNLKLIISKYENGTWPLKIMLSLEVEIHTTGHRFTASFARLRRGSQDLSTGLAWAYFGADLTPLKQLNLFSSAGFTTRIVAAKKNIKNEQYTTNRSC